MIGSDIASVPEQGQTLEKALAGCQKKISELVGEDIFVNTEGEVHGTIKQVKNFTEFSKGEKEGYYFPITLGEKYTGEITLKGMNTKEKKSEDKDWVLKLTNGTDSVFTFTADGAPELRLTFKHAKLSAQE